MIINTDFKECETCGRYFIKLNKHHINGNHKDDSKKNTINICKDCHTAIHKNVTNRRERSFNSQQEKKDGTDERIYELRKKLHKSKYGNFKHIPEDDITKNAISMKRMRKIYQKVIENSKNIKEIRYK